jgi:hypothetical protein
MHHTYARLIKTYLEESPGHKNWNAVFFRQRSNRLFYYKYGAQFYDLYSPLSLVIRDSLGKHNVFENSEFILHIRTVAPGSLVLKI